ncbi:Calcineurin-like phosphoesterase superfamily domain-containing protein [Streptosporangium canum]|uniref:Calcineurin-like phosphoesterase superfamily domain-containing protein n=1 Tax=Streptosporangium canum TaxID=324952 RepID=A0A1I3L5G2_9ACTN|nr:metallophosphoesterase [Streptosporangium canum]SFI79786.1 Calcineurin-like phosphoesterase superfamily domain-containing protein [Streptosporangium canum]
MGLTKRIVVISDTQLPYEDKRALRNVIAFIGEYQPDAVYQIGDLMDYPTPSRWSKGTRNEFEQQVISHSDYGKKNFLEPLRAVYSGPVGILEGNHDERPRVYLAQNAPALAEFSETFHFAKLLDFDGFGVDLIKPFFKIGQDTVLVHGHEIKGMSQIAGTSAYNHATKAGANIVMGHTHRLGIRRHTAQYIGGKPVRRWGFEVGNLMDHRKTQYLGAGGVANWQSGFGLLYVGKYDVSPHAIDVWSDGSFVVEGERYGAIKRGSGGKFATAA